jgi:hypothetical protein
MLPKAMAITMSHVSHGVATLSAKLLKNQRMPAELRSDRTAMSGMAAATSQEARIRTSWARAKANANRYIHLLQRRSQRGRLSVFSFIVLLLVFTLTTSYCK